MQPTSTATMPLGMKYEGVRPGLQQLLGLQSVMILEDRDCKERTLGDSIPCGPWGLCCGPPKKKYFVTDGENAEIKLFDLQEESTCCRRRFCPRSRSFSVSIQDHSNGQESFRLTRNVDCGGCCCTECYPMGCYGHYAKSCTNAFKMKVEGADGSPIGFIEQQTSCCALEFHILNQDHQVQYKFQTTAHNGCCENPCCLFPCNFIPPCFRWCGGCKDVIAKLESPTGQEVGSINWRNPGCVDGCLCLKHKFAVNFPADADANMRATLIGATLLLETYFHPWHGIWYPVVMNFLAFM